MGGGAFVWQRPKEGAGEERGRSCARVCVCVCERERGGVCVFFVSVCVCVR